MKPMKPMKPLEPIRKGSEEANTWWPSELGQPSVSGSSNGLRYAYFSAKHRLAVDDGRKIRLYDTGSENISGFLTSNGRDLALQTADGAKKLSSLMYTAELSQAELRAVRRTAPPALKRPLGRLARCWASISKAQSAPYLVLEAVPEQLTSVLAEVVAALNELLAESPEAERIRRYKSGRFDRANRTTSPGTFDCQRGTSRGCSERA
jgi:hypothetical protein